MFRLMIRESETRRVLKICPQMVLERAKIRKSDRSNRGKIGEHNIFVNPELR